jgi:PAS domain S-box-containing protein
VVGKWIHAASSQRPLRRSGRRFLTLSFEQWFGVALLAMTAFHVAALWALFNGIPGALAPAAWFVVLVSAVAIIGLAFTAYSYTRTLSLDLRFADERLLLTLESGRRVAWDWDVASGRDLWLGDLKTMFGVDARHFAGRVEDFHRRLHPDDRGAVAKAVAEARTSRTPYRATFRVLRPDGSTRWVNANGEFFYDANGCATRMLGIAADITEQAHAEATLRQSELHFREIADTAPVLLWLSAPDGRCTYVNQSWLNFTGRHLEQELGTGWSAAIHPQDRRAILDAFLGACGRGQPCALEYRLRRHDGVYRWVFDAAVPRFGPDHTLVGYIGSAIDITDLKAARRALSNLSQRLIEAQESERAGIARDLDDEVVQRVALLTIELESLMRDLPGASAAIQARVGDVRGRAGDLVEHLQALSHRLHSSKLELLGIGATAASYCRELADRQQLAIDFFAEDVPDDLSPEISLSLFRVLQEGLANAIAHSGVRSFDVSLRGGPDAIELAIADAGAGFDPNSVLTGSGTGLVGLQERLDIVGGNLSIESGPGTGTRVRGRVPRVRRPPPDPEWAGSSSHATPLEPNQYA